MEKFIEKTYLNNFHFSLVRLESRWQNVKESSSYSRIKQTVWCINYEVKNWVGDGTSIITMAAKHNAQRKYFY